MSLAVYVHWPWCQSKCPYCDFNSHVAAQIDHDAWRAAYRRELEHYARLLPGRRVTSVFFGGGTPSLMEAATVDSVLQNISNHWPIAEDAEITLEANPTSVESAKFAAFRRTGINRLSLGVQSLRDEALKFLGRAHDSHQARRAIDLAAEHFPRYSFDLIYARNGQTPESWQEELQEALALADGHISLYQLTIEPNTQFHTRAQRGEPLAAPDSLAAQMYEQTQRVLQDAGLPAYEISNHARPGRESRHNLAYWRYEDYIGIGPGAHGRFKNQNAILSSENHRAPEVWLRQVHEQGHGLRLCDPLDAATAKREALMMGLRLISGISRDDWQKKFDAALDDFLPVGKIARLIEEGYLAANAQTLRATPAGLQRLNAVLGYLME